MKTSVHFFSVILLTLFKWLFPNFFNERGGAKFLIPIPVFNNLINKNHILLIPIICTVMYQGKVSAKNSKAFKPVESINVIINTKAILQPAATEILITNLYASVNNVYNLADGNMVLFDDAYSNAVDGADARKLTNWGENFGMIKENIKLAVEKRKIMRANDTIFYDMSNLRSIGYKLEIQASNLNHPGMVGFLEDVFLGTRTALSLTETTRYLFNVTSTAGSSAKNRFRAIFFSISSGALPVNFTSINTNRVQNKTVINWQVNNQLNIEGYQVQSSLNGIAFTTVGRVSAITNSTMVASYQWIDDVIATGTKYYRVLSIDIAGNNKYSPIVTINGNKNKKNFSVLSNPVKGNDMKIMFNQKEKGNYSIRVFNGDSKLIFLNTTLHTEGTSTYNFALPVNTVSGYYYVEIVDAKNTKEVLPIVILN